MASTTVPRRTVSGLRCTRKVTADEFVAGLSLARIGYYDTTRDYHRAGEHIVADYRFLVSRADSRRPQRPDVVRMYGGRYDITNQWSSYAGLSWLDVSHES